MIRQAPAEPPHLPAERPHLLVTGAGGLVGSHLVPLLRRRVPGAAVTAILRTDAPPPWRSREHDVGVLTGDLRDAAVWTRVPVDVTHVFHLAAAIPRVTGDRWSAEMAQANLLPLARLLERSRAWPTLRHVIYSSSVSVYGPSPHVLTERSPKRPADLYGSSKLAGERLLAPLASRGVAVTHLRYSSIYGHGQWAGTVLPKMIDDARQKGEILVYGDGSRVQDFVHAEDAAAANVCAYRSGASGAFNVGAGISTSMGHLAQLIASVFTEGAARVVLREDLADTAPSLEIDISKAAARLDYKPAYGLEAGLQRLRHEIDD